MSKHQKWIFYCDEEHLPTVIKAAGRIKQRVNKVADFFPPERVTIRFERESKCLVLHGRATKNGTFVIEQGE